MRKATIAGLALVALTGCLWGQTAHPPSPAELAEISARGRALAEYDAAAWHASDAVEPLKPAQGTIERYVARKTAQGWVVMWGRFNQDKSAFLIVYEARQGSDPAQFTVTRHDPPLEDRDWYLRAAKAHALTRAEFLRDLNPQRSYNISILPAPSGDWYVYALPAQTEADIQPYGGDVRYTVSADGTRILETRRMHQALLETRLGAPRFFVHTHVLNDLPEDSDVFYALTRKASEGEWIATALYVYQVHPDGSLSYLGRSEEIRKAAEEGQFDALLGPYKAMTLATLRRLLHPDQAHGPLEVFAALTGARCAGGAIWLSYSLLLHNIGDRRIILYKAPLLNSQARFAATEADLEADKYEKLAFFTPVEPDFSDNRSFMVLSPGMTYTEEREYPILGLDLKGKGIMQFLFFTWPLGKEKEADAQSARLAKAGSLYTSTVATPPIPLKIEPQLLTTCTAK